MLLRRPQFALAEQLAKGERDNAARLRRFDHVGDVAADAAMYGEANSARYYGDQFLAGAPSDRPPP